MNSAIWRRGEILMFEQRIPRNIFQCSPIREKEYLRQNVFQYIRIYLQIHLNVYLQWSIFLVRALWTLQACLTLSLLALRAHESILPPADLRWPFLFPIYRQPFRNPKSKFLVNFGNFSNSGSPVALSAPDCWNRYFQVYFNMFQNILKYIWKYSSIYFNTAQLKKRISES